MGFLSRVEEDAAPLIALSWTHEVLDFFESTCVAMDATREWLDAVGLFDGPPVAWRDRHAVSLSRERAGSDANVGNQAARRNRHRRGPRLCRLASACIVTCTHGHVKFRTADGLWEMRKAVREMVMAGADFVKTAASGGFWAEDETCSVRNYTYDELEALVDEAHAWGVPG